MIITNADLKTRIQSLDSFQSHVIMLIQLWDDFNIGDVETENPNEVKRIATLYVDTRDEFAGDKRTYAYESVWNAVSQAIPEITNPTE